MGIFSNKKERKEFFDHIEEELISDETDKPIPTVTDAPHTLTPDEVSFNFGVNNPKQETFLPKDKTPLEALRERMKVAQSSAASEQHDKPVTFVPKPKAPDNMQMQIDIEAVTERSLLQKCKPYTLDEKGHDVSLDVSPLYELESVAQILKNENDKAFKEITEKYHLTTENGKSSKSKENKKPVTVKSEPIPSAVAPEKEKPDIRADKYAQMVSKSLEDKTYPEPQADESNIQFISDIDSNKETFSAPDTSDASATGTIKFTPVKDYVSNTQTIKISSMTRPLDIKDELIPNTSEDTVEDTAGKLNETSFEQYSPSEEYTDISQAKRFVKKLSLKKRRAFLQSTASGCALFLLLLFLFPTLNDLTLQYPFAFSVFFAVILTLSFICNVDMILSFKDIFTNKASPDILSSLAYISTIILNISAVKKEKSPYEMVLLCAIVIFARSLTKFFKASLMLSNFKQIATKRPKKAAALIADQATSFAMANNSVEGDALIAAPKRTEFVDDYFKYSEYGEILKGKLGIASVIIVLLSAIMFIAAYKFFDSSFSALIFPSAMCCFAALPILFAVDTLPLFCAAKTLNKKGAAILGLVGAEKLEDANCAVVSSSDLFPIDTITLHSMKVLADNDIDTTIMKATSLTGSVNSPLYPVFSKIAGTNSSYVTPDSDTVKYEEHLGLSGWVDNKLLFIGNRTLMEAHGISVPSIELDKKILKEGYFPVYIADAAKACALIIVEYNVSEEIASQVRKLTNSGITLLVSNNDPNITEEMICDYFGLYDDSVKIMSNAGNHIYKTAIKKAERCTAAAAFRGVPFTLVSILNCAARIKKSNLILKMFYLALALTGITLFIYLSFAGGTEPQIAFPLIYGISATLVSFIAFCFKKP